MDYREKILYLMDKTKSEKILKKVYDFLKYLYIYEED